MKTKEQKFIEIVRQYADCGYGFMMDAISREWQSKDPVGALSVGPCYGMLKHKKKNNVVARSDQPLVASLEDHQIVIRIGINTLAYCFDISTANNPYVDAKDAFIQSFKVIKQIEFANDVVSEMMSEGEDGSSMLTDLIETACDRAVDNGSGGVDESGRVTEG